MKKKRGFSIATDNIVYWILGLLALAGFITLAIVLKGKGEGALGFLKSFFRIG